MKIPKGLVYFESRRKYSKRNFFRDNYSFKHKIFFETSLFKRIITNLIEKSLIKKFVFSREMKSIFILKNKILFHNIR